MASVDDRIVQMQFDNAAFEKKLDSTLASLANLDKALKFDGAKQGLSELNGIGDKFNLGNMGTTIEGVSAKFLALSTIAVTALAQITSSAISAGTRIVKSLSLDQVLAGYQEYQTNIASIQTILSNTKADNTTLEDVTAALDELNHYADQTIYNFGQMVRNIGTFSAAGVDLRTSVLSIKGIANIAAISGSSAEQASVAMYQLSQALASGTLKLQDWNSVVNAGMGGEIFQKALFETGKALGTIKNIPMEQTFDQWKDAGNSFRNSLQDGWVTAEVLTTTLSAFTGEMTEAQLTALGYTKEQAAAMIDLGKTGVDAATKVRTITQLIDTTKEAIGSGWSESFRIILGDFNEATDLFTNLSNAVSGMVNNMSEARNTMLQTFKDLGGRSLLIEALRTSFRNLGEILKPIKDAFREIFPKKTAFDLFNLVKSFELLAIKLRPSEKTIQNLHSIFKGFFSVLQVGWEIIKEGTKFIIGLFSAFGAGSGSFLSFAAKIGDFFTEINNKLVEGKGIENFFEKLGTVVQVPIAFLKDLKDVIVDFFSNLKDSSVVDAAGESFGRFGQRFDDLREAFNKMKDLWKPVSDGLERIVGVLDKVWTAISNWFKDLGRKMAAVLQPGDFDSVVDAVNVGLLGAISALLYKFVNKGLKVDLGGGVIESLTGTFQQLTGVLSAMQTSLKADALFKIASAIGILSASLLVLSTIDSDALTKALAAMAVGFTQLMAAFAVLNKLAVGPKSAATFSVLSAGMILLSTALLTLSVAVKILSTLDWNELAKGLTGVTVLLGVLVAASIPLSSTSGGLIRAGIGLTAVAFALNILAVAMKIFATLNWGEIGKGMASIGGGLLIIAIAMNLMPKNMILTGAGLLAVATSLTILGGAMKIFATLSWKEIGKGMVTIAGALVIIAGAMQLMPTNIPITAAGLLLVSVSLIAIAEAIRMMGGLSWKEIGKGLTTLAGSLLVLAVAMQAMTGTIGGAAAIGVASLSLLVLAKVLKEFADVSWSELVHGLVAVAATLTVLGLAALALEPAVPALLALGAALFVVGAAFALFGAGVALVATGLEVLSKLGASSAKAITELVKALGKGIPAFFAGLAEGFIEMIQTLAEAAPVLTKEFVVILGHILEGLTELIPKVLVLVGELINGILEYIGNEGVPNLIQAGIRIILALLTGIRDNIKEVVKLVSEIIRNFIDAFAAELPNITKTIANFVLDLFTNVAEQTGRIAGSLLFDVGVSFMKGLSEGITEGAAGGVIKWFKELATNVLDWIGDVAKTLWQKGIDFITGLINGINDKAQDVISFFKNLPANVLLWLGNLIDTLFDAGADILRGFYRGITSIWESVSSFIAGIPRKIIDKLPNPLSLLKSVGEDIIQGLWNGMKEIWENITNWFVEIYNLIPGWAKKLLGIHSPSTVMMDVGVNIMAGMFIGMKDEWGETSKWLSTVDPAGEMSSNLSKNLIKVFDDVISFFNNLPKNVIENIGNTMTVLWSTGFDIITGFLNGINAGWDKVIAFFTELGSKLVQSIKNPSLILYPVGVNVIEGFLNGMLLAWSSVLGWINAAGEFVANTLRNSLGISSPSRVFMEIGRLSILGFILGFNDTLYDDKTMEASAAEFVDRTKNVLKNSLDDVSRTLGNTSEFNPAITPVLDLTQVRLGSQKISDYISSSAKLASSLSYSQASIISSSPSNIIAQQYETDKPEIQTGVKFEQNIYAPSQLSTSDIYKQTRNQITMAKEELSIP